MLNIHERYVAVLHNWSQIVLVFLLEQELHETLDDVHFYIAAVVSRYQHFALRVQNEYSRKRHVLDLWM